MSSQPFVAIGIDVGGTKTAAGLVIFPEGRVEARREIPTDSARPGEAILADIDRLVTELASEASSSDRRLDAIGLGVCELVGLDGRVMSRNCVAWDDVNVAQRLAKTAPTLVEADVRAAALAEALLGAGRPYRIFLYVTVGTGISSCLVIERRPFTGARGAAGTMASSALSWPCQHCGEPSRRALEEIASGPALVARYNAQRPAVATAQDVLAAAAMDPFAKDVVTGAAVALGSAIAWLVNLLDPEAVIIGGGLGLSEGLYWDSLVAAARDHIWSSVHRDLPILRAAIGRDAGLVGAAAAAMLKFQERR